MRRECHEFGGQIGAKNQGWQQSYGPYLGMAGTIRWYFAHLLRARSTKAVMATRARRGYRCDGRKSPTTFLRHASPQVQLFAAPSTFPTLTRSLTPHPSSKPLATPRNGLRPILRAPVARLLQPCLSRPRHSMHSIRPLSLLSCHVHLAGRAQFEESPFPIALTMAVIVPQLVYLGGCMAESRVVAQVIHDKVPNI